MTDRKGKVPSCAPGLRSTGAGFQSVREEGPGITNSKTWACGLVELQLRIAWER